MWGRTDIVLRMPVRGSGATSPSAGLAFWAAATSRARRRVEERISRASRKVLPPWGTPVARTKPSMSKAHTPLWHRGLAVRPPSRIPRARAARKRKARPPETARSSSRVSIVAGERALAMSAAITAFAQSWPMGAINSSGLGGSTHGGTALTRRCFRQLVSMRNHANIFNTAYQVACGEQTGRALRCGVWASPTTR